MVEVLKAAVTSLLLLPQRIDKQDSINEKAA